MPSATLPDFPSGLHETHLHRLPLSKILAKDPTTESQLFEICKDQGFFYLDLTETPRGEALLAAADHLQDVSGEAFKLPDAVKAAVGQNVTKSIMGWKPSGAIAHADPHKRSDVGQFWNVSKDDVLQTPGCLNLPYPSPLKEEIQEGKVFKQFMGDAHSTGMVILDALARKVGIPAEDFAEKHKFTELSGDHVRLTWGPGDPEATSEGGKTEANTRITTFGHTDFGSITLLFNWLGGLQIENGKTGEWEWVRPVPGHAIVNLGDTMKEFSGHRLASGKHRVVAAPGLQAQLERYSVVYFVRPTDEVYMEDLTVGEDGERNAKGMQVQEVGGVVKRWKAGEWSTARAQALGNNFGKKMGKD